MKITLEPQDLERFEESYPGIMEQYGTEELSQLEDLFSKILNERGGKALDYVIKEALAIPKQ